MGVAPANHPAGPNPGVTTTPGAYIRWQRCGATLPATAGRARDRRPTSPDEGMADRAGGVP